MKEPGLLAPGGRLPGHAPQASPWISHARRVVGDGATVPSPGMGPLPLRKSRAPGPMGWLLVAGSPVPSQERDLPAGTCCLEGHPYPTTINKLMNKPWVWDPYEPLVCNRTGTVPG